MKNNRSFKAMLTAVWMTLTAGFKGKRFRRAIGLILVFANLMTSTGLVLAKEMDDEASETPSGIVTEMTEEPSSESSDETSEENSSETSDTSDVSDTSDSSDVSDTPDSSDTSEVTDTDITSSDESTDTEMTEDPSVTEDTVDPSDTSDPEASTDGTDILRDGVFTPLPDDPSLMDPTMITDANTILRTFRGDGYSVTVAYGPETEIPSDAELSVHEITDTQKCDEYYEKLTGVMDEQNVNRARFFDISLLVDGAECEPKEGTTVSVKILLDEQLNGDVSVVHLPDDQEAGVVDNTASNTDNGMEIRFEAEGFSAYAIVQGPSASEVNYLRVTDLDQLAEKGASGKGVYFGHPYGFTFTDEEFQIKTGRKGIKKTPTSSSTAIDPYVPSTGAVLYYFERQGTNSNQFKIYCLGDGGVKKYLKQNNDSLVFDSTGSVFTITENTQDYSNVDVVRNVDFDHTFDITSNLYLITVQGGKSGQSFATYKDKDQWMPMCFWYADASEGDAYGLDGKTYGLLNTKGGNGGRTLQATSSNTGNLDSCQISVVAKEGSQNQDKLYITAEDGATMWTFEWDKEDEYFLKAEVDGSVKYLTIDDSGLSMSDTPCAIRVIPGSGTASGQISLMKGSNMLTFSGDASTGFNINTNNDRWLYLVEERDLTPDYKKTYSAKKISVSDPQLENGSQVIVYTRRWEKDPVSGKYEYKYYAINHDGSLLPCFESGDYLQWTDNMINTLLWDFGIYYWEGTDDENGYYELFNEYSEKYITPRTSTGEVLSDEPIGIQLEGRTHGRYYSTIIAWDDPSYAYSSVITTDQEEIDVGGFANAEDFYFAIIQDDVTGDVDLSPIETVDNNLYGIEMKMQDFTNKPYMSNLLVGQSNPEDKHVQNILSNQLGEDGYPTITRDGQSLSALFTRPETVNHLFIKSTHSATGYFEYDSTKNFASLQSNGDFRVYQELGTSDESSKSTLKHGQFLPYNDLQDNHYAVKNPTNLYSINARPNTNLGLLPDSDPRKYERLYLVDNPNLQFGMEMKASFIQTPSGLDDWGHDIIYEFTGDDDFWFYVDKELVIDLGGCHSAMAGSINFATGQVIVEGESTTLNTTLKDIFYNNFKDREKAAGVDEATAEANAQAYVDGIFVETREGNFVFRDYTTHEMKMFYLERGGGASNLHMKFNQSSVKPGKVVLGKTVSGIDETDSVMAQFPYQIFYRKHNDQTDTYETFPLTNQSSEVNVVYRGTNDPVYFEPTREIDGVTYSNVFFLKPGEECEISFPDDTYDYSVIECGINPYIYSHVYVNGVELPPTQSTTYANGRNDYGIDFVEVRDRTNVKYVNEIDPAALRVLNIQKKLYEEDGITEITAENCDVSFTFRLYLSGEYDGAIPMDRKGEYAAYMYNYHVKDPNGNYCRWDPTTMTFVSLGTTDYSTFNQLEKQSATFQTSMNGTISKIPAGYTVEVKGLMIGSHYMVEERDNEVPDGYSRREYYYYSEDTVKEYESMDPINETMGEDVNPKVVVNNLKGYGLRVYKEWTDKDFMDSHENVFFAVYKKTGPDTYELADTANHDVVHCIRTNSDTSYWYYEHLDSGLSLSDYEIREVKLTGNYTISSTGIVTGYSSVEPINEGGKITLNGRMTGATQDASYEYTVSYEKGTLLDGSNIRVDQVTNDRPGLGLTKTAWDGTTLLPNAEFTVVSDDGTFRKKFVSDANGKITKAFFVEGMVYHLTEIKTPIGFYCPTEEIRVIFRNGEFEVYDASGGDFGTTKVMSGEDTLLGIKNKIYTLRVLKVDAVDGRPVQGAHFALHKQIKVGGVTMFDYDPVPGFEDIVSGPDGLISELDNQLAPGTYELRELSAPLGYLNMTHNVRFRVGDTGGITLVNNYTDVEVTSADSADHSAKNFEMKIKNTADSRELTVTKTVTGNLGSRDMKFTFTATFKDANGNAYDSGVVKTITPAGQEKLVTLDNTGSMEFQLAHGETIRIALPPDTRYTITENSTGYNVTWKIDAGQEQTGAVASGILTADSTVAFTNTKQGVIPTGIDFTVKAILGAIMVISGAGSVMLFAKRRRRYAGFDEDDTEE